MQMLVVILSTESIVCGSVEKCPILEMESIGGMCASARMSKAFRTSAKGILCALGNGGGGNDARRQATGCILSIRS